MICSFNWFVERWDNHLAWRGIVSVSSCRPAIDGGVNPFRSQRESGIQVESVGEVSVGKSKSFANKQIYTQHISRHAACFILVCQAASSLRYPPGIHNMICVKGFVKKFRRKVEGFIMV